MIGCFGLVFNSVGKGDFVLTGEPRMWERPIKDLVDALRQLGADIEYMKMDGYPPLRIRANGLAGGTVSIRGKISSQYLTGLLMAAPLAQQAPIGMPLPSAFARVTTSGWTS